MDVLKGTSEYFKRFKWYWHFCYVRLAIVNREIVHRKRKKSGVKKLILV